VENVTDEVSNPFGMRPPCPHDCAGGHRAVHGYGDANADFHVIGDHPGVHGGDESGVPFTDEAAGERILDVLDAVGLLETRDPLRPENAFLSYLHCCCVQEGETPTDRAYAEFERFFDAELRAIAADVLLPVGERATAHVLSEYTAQAHRIAVDMARLDGQQIRGRGFLVVPISDPRDWEGRDGAEGFESIVADLRAVLARDYHQIVDLGRFLPDGDPYMVR
jgi:uracil-DNA glycosylase family 4